MIEFREPEKSDKSWVDALLVHGSERGCEYNFTNLYAWNGPYDQEVARLDDFLLVRLCGSLGCSYLYPVGRGDVRTAIDALSADFRPCGKPLQLVCLSPEHKKELEGLYPGKFRYEADRDGFDYLYEIDRLADLTGKKLHNKRTQINHFLEEHPDWTFEEITPENLPECRKMDEEWYRENRGYQGDDTLVDEGAALKLAFDAYEELGLDGGLLRSGGKVIAFSMGDHLTADTYDVHFEKAFSAITGAYTMMNREFARFVREQYPRVQYLNREDDMGVAGLRQAKESYYPDLMAEKYSATLI